MLNRHDIETGEIALDACLDRLVSGQAWRDELPTDPAERHELIGLLAVSGRLTQVASMLRAPRPETKQRVWQRVSAAPELRANRSFFRRLSAFRVLYTPPPNPNIVHRVLFARVPGVPPLIVRYAEAS